VGFDKIHGREDLIEGIIAVIIPFALATFLLGHEDVGVHIVCRGAFIGGSTRDSASGGKLPKHMLRVEKFWVNVFRGIEFPADNEDFGRDISRQEKMMLWCSDMLAYVTLGSYLEEGGLVASTFPNS